MLAGRARLDAEPCLRAFSILTGEEHELGRDELELLLRLPAEGWQECDEPLLDGLLLKGLAVLEGTPEARRDEQLAAAQWNLFGALFHARGRWSGVDVGLGVPDRVEAELVSAATLEWVERHGRPPTHFPSAAGSLSTHELPLTEREPDGELFAALGGRRTARRFDRSRRMREDELALLLRTVYGAQGIATIAGDVAGIRRTSPSGGGLHPIEAYPLVLDVEGVQPGLHHYHAGRHALELLEPLSEEDARELAVHFVCGQGYFRDASLLVVLVARFARSFWKYRRHEKAYAVTLMDAGHLSQTFYLVCGALGLGAFVTAAVNNADIDERLGLDGFGEGSLAISGCGAPAEHGSGLEPEFVPYRPR